MVSHFIPTLKMPQFTRCWKWTRSNLPENCSPTLTPVGMMIFTPQDPQVETSYSTKVENLTIPVTCLSQLQWVVQKLNTIKPALHVWWLETCTWPWITLKEFRKGVSIWAKWDNVQCHWETTKYLPGHGIHVFNVKSILGKILTWILCLILYVRSVHFYWWEIRSLCFTCVEFM